MNNKLLRVLNPILAVLATVQAFTISAMVFGFGGSYRHLLFATHKANGQLLIAVIVIHVVINRWWIKVAFRRKRS